MLLPDRNIGLHVSPVVAILGRQWPYWTHFVACPTSRGGHGHIAHRDYSSPPGLPASSNWSCPASGTAARSSAARAAAPPTRPAGSRTGSSLSAPVGDRYVRDRFRER